MVSKVAAGGIIIGGAVVAIVAAFLVSSYAIPGKPYPVGSHIVPNPYVNRGFGLSIGYPDGWSATEFRRLDANTTTLVSFNDSNAAIDIVANRMGPGESLDSIDAKSRQLALSTDKSHTKSIESEGPGTLAGQDVKVRTWTIATSGVMYKQVVYHLVHRGFLLSISFISPAGVYNSELTQFNNSLKTLTLF